MAYLGKCKNLDGPELRYVTDRALRPRKQLLPAQVDGIPDIAPGGHPEGARVEKQEIEGAVGLFRHHAERSLSTGGLGVRTILTLEYAGGDAHVVQERRRILLL